MGENGGTEKAGQCRKDLSEGRGGKNLGEAARKVRNRRGRERGRTSAGGG